MSSLQSFARTAGLLAGLSAVQRALGMLTSVVLARGLGAVGLGLYNVVGTTWNSAYGLLKLGVDTAMHVQVAEADRSALDRGRALGAALVVQAAACAGGVAVCLVGADALAGSVFGQPDFAPWIQVAGGFLVLQFAYQYLYSALAGMHAFRPFARVSAWTAVATLVAVTGGMWGGGLPGAVAGAASATTLGVVALTVVLRGVMRKQGITLRFDRTLPAARSLIRLGLPFYGASLLAVPVAYLLQGVVGRTEGAEGLGILRVVATLTAVISLVPASVGPAAVSAFVAARTSGAHGAFARHAAFQLRAVWLGCLVVALAGCAVIPWVVSFVFGPDFAEAVGAARLGLLGAAALAVEGVVGQVLFSAERVRQLSVLLTVRALVFLGSGWVMIPSLGVEGYFAAELFSLGIGLALYIWRGRARTGMAAPLATLLILHAVSTGVILSAAGRSPYLELTAAAATTAVAMLVGLRWVFTRAELQFLARIVASLRSPSTP